MHKLVLIQVLRAFAVLAVVLFHLSESSRTEFGFTFIESFSNFGYAGVDLFFVISGFIIFYTSSKYLENKKPFQFLLKRLLRLYPVYWIVFGGLFSAALLLGDSSSMSASFQMGDLPGSLSLWFGHEMINGVSWSLSYELFFYVLFFLVLLNRKFILIGIAVLCLAIVNLFFAPTWLTEGVLQYLTNPFLIEFAFGVLAGYLVKQKIGGVYIGVLGLVLLFAGGILYDHQISRIFLYGITSFLIVLGFSSWESKSKHTFKFLRLPTLIGDASYSMYLIHLPLLRIAHKMTAGQVNSEWASYLFNILIILLIIGVSIGFYLLIEKPLIKYLNGRLAGSKKQLK